MATLKKLKELEYNETLTILLIQKDEQLNSIFGAEFKIPLALMITLSEQGKIDNLDTQALIESIFQDVILTRSDLIELYEKLARANNIDVSVVEKPLVIRPDSGNVIDTVEEVDEIEPRDSVKLTTKLTLESVEEPIIEVVTKEKTKKEKVKKENSLPRRYGKEKVLLDISKQGGKATPLQIAMLRINDMRNTYVNLQARTIKDTFNEDKMLSDVDCREITSAIQILERKLESILKRKK